MGRGEGGEGKEREREEKDRKGRRGKWRRWEVGSDAHLEQARRLAKASPELDCTSMAE